AMARDASHGISSGPILDLAARLQGHFDRLPVLPDIPSLTAEATRARLAVEAFGEWVDRQLPSSEGEDQPVEPPGPAAPPSGGNAPIPVRTIPRGRLDERA